MTAIAPRILRPFLRRAAYSKSPPLFLSGYIHNSKPEIVTSVQRRAGHTLNHPNEKLDGGKAKSMDETAISIIEAVDKQPDFTLNERFTLARKLMNERFTLAYEGEERAISIIEAVDEQPDFTVDERYILARRLMCNPTDYALFKAYEGEERAMFLQYLLKSKPYKKRAMFLQYLLKSKP